MSMQPMLRTSKISFLVTKKIISGNLSEFESALLEKELISLEKSDARQAMSLRALSLSAEGRFEESFKLHRDLIGMEPNEPTFLGNYATSMVISGLFGEAAKMFVEAWNMDKAVIRFLEDAIANAIRAGNYALASELEEKFRALVGKDYLGGENYSEIVVAEIPLEQLYQAACASGAFADWARDEEEDAWKYLQ